jgi:hypothetical protein
MLPVFLNRGPKQQTDDDVEHNHFHEADEQFKFPMRGRRETASKMSLVLASLFLREMFSPRTVVMRRMQTFQTASFLRSFALVNLDLVNVAAGDARHFDVPVLLKAICAQTQRTLIASVAHHQRKRLTFANNHQLRSVNVSACHFSSPVPAECVSRSYRLTRII